MSKIGRKPIALLNAEVSVKNNAVHYKGAKLSGVYNLPKELHARTENGMLYLEPVSEQSNQKKRDMNRVWGLHRALLNNAIKGSQAEFEKKVEIEGLGFKVAKSGEKLVFSLGYSHKIDFQLPKSVSIDIDKSGQKLLLKSVDKHLVGQVCSDIRSLRLPEPYKGTGIKVAQEVIIRKAGKTKS